MIYEFKGGNIDKFCSSSQLNLNMIYAWTVMVFAQYTHHHHPHSLCLAISQLPVVWSEQVRTFVLKYSVSGILNWDLRTEITRKCALRHINIIISISAFSARIWVRPKTATKACPSKAEVNFFIYLEHFWCCSSVVVDFNFYCKIRKILLNIFLIYPC